MGGVKNWLLGKSNFVGKEVKKFNETIIKYDTVLINLSPNIKKTTFETFQQNSQKRVTMLIGTHLNTSDLNYTWSHSQNVIFIKVYIKAAVNFRIYFRSNKSNKSKFISIILTMNNRKIKLLHIAFHVSGFFSWKR